jgi:hypothetical protein
MFAPTSRYYGLPTATTTLSDGRVVTWVRRRFLPQPQTLTQIGSHVVQPGEVGRLDLIAAREIGSAPMWWQLADAAGAMDPDDVAATAGTALRVTLPAGIPQAGVNLLGTGNG